MTSSDDAESLRPRHGFQSIATSTTTIDSNHIWATSSAIMSSSSSITTPVALRVEPVNGVDHSPGSKSRLPQALPSAFGSTSSEPTTTWSIDSAQGRLQTSSMDMPSGSIAADKILVGGLLGGIGLVLCVAYAVWWLHRRKRYRRGMKSLADFDMITTIDPLSEPSQLAGDAPFPPPYSEVT
ncbi:hypothetical protein B0H14DRAFT_2674463 [Mycena olivaceomarginata]|nr:hypothetical protein B0H14DRAFT_2674463 [Mycena olivaceomarginata]